MSLPAAGGPEAVQLQAMEKGSQSVRRRVAGGRLAARSIGSRHVSRRVLEALPTLVLKKTSLWKADSRQ